MKGFKIYLAIYVLTAVDIAFTGMGLSSGAIEEANPLMNYFMQISVPLTAVGVLIFTAAVLFLLYRVRKRVRWLPIALFGITAIKIWIVLLHVSWMTAAYY